MPWPSLKDPSDHEIRAIYEYLKAVPCIQGNYPGEPADRCASERRSTQVAHKNGVAPTTRAGEIGECRPRYAREAQ